MTIRQRKGGWYIIDGMTCTNLGPFLTFLEAYTILDKLQNRKVLS